MNVVILAAGMGKRMQSALPKVLHPVAGKPLLSHVIDTARSLSPAKLCVIYGHGGAAVLASLDQHKAGPGTDISAALQEPQLGTGHAVQQALPHLDDSQPTLVLYGDVPLTSAASLKRLAEAAGQDKLGILTVVQDNPFGLGRIVRVGGAIQRIVEEKDATEAERLIKEINSGIMVIPTAKLKQWLGKLKNENAQGEFYQRNVAQCLLDKGVTLADPARIDVRGELSCGRDVSIDVGCVFEGKVEIGEGATIGPNCVLINARIGAGANIKAFTHIEEAVVGDKGQIGPYARLRPGTEQGEDVHVGNFVEIKNSQVAAHSKANHLAYVGDATVGSRVNIGAGTITCNYDGANKFRTVIEDDAFIGSDSQLVAPVTVGAGATIGAGTTLTKNAPAGKLTISRPKQLTIEGWTRPVKVKKA